MSLPFDANESATTLARSQEEIDKLTINDELPLIDHVRKVFTQGSQHEKETLILSLPYFIRQCGPSIHPYLPQAFDAISLGDSSFHIEAAESFSDCIHQKLLSPQLLSKLLSPICHMILDFEDSVSIVYLDLLALVIDSAPAKVNIHEIAEVLIQKSEVFEKAHTKMGASRAIAKFLRFLGSRISSNNKFVETLASSLPSDSIAVQMDQSLESLCSFQEPSHHFSPTLQPYQYLPSTTVNQADSVASQQRSQGNYTLSHSALFLPLPVFISNDSSPQSSQDPLSFSSIFPFRPHPTKASIRQNSTPLTCPSFRCFSTSHHTAPVFHADFNSLPTVGPDKANSTSTSSPTITLINNLLSRILTLLSDPEPEVSLAILSHAPPTDPALVDVQGLFPTIPQLIETNPFCLSTSSCPLDIACWTAGPDWVSKNVLAKLIQLTLHQSPTTRPRAASKDTAQSPPKGRNVDKSTPLKTATCGLRLLIRRTACCCLARIACILPKAERFNRICQPLVKKAGSVGMKERKTEEEKKDDKGTARSKGQDSDADDDLATIFVYLRSLSHILLTFVGHDKLLSLKEEKGKKDIEPRPDKQLGVQSVNNLLSFFKQAVQLALHPHPTPEPISPSYSLLADCAFVFPTLVRFGSFARYIHLLPMTNQLSSPQALVLFSPFLQLQLNALLGCDSVAVRLTLVRTFCWICDQCSVILDKEDKIERKEKEERSVTKPDSSFLSRRRLWQQVQSLTAKEKEKECERVAGYVLKMIERFLMDSSADVVCECFQHLPCVFHSVLFTTEQLSTFTQQFVMFLQRISPVITPNQSHPPTPPPSPTPSGKTSANLYLSWRQLISLFYSILHLLPLFSSPQIVQSILPFFLSFIHQPPFNLSFAANYSFCRTVRSLRSKRVRTDIMSCLILSLAHSNYARHRISFVHLAAACFLNFSRKWCKVTLLAPLCELLTDPNKTVVQKAMKMLPLLRASLILPQDQFTLSQLNASYATLSRSPNHQIKFGMSTLRSTWKAMDAVPSDEESLIGRPYQFDMDKLLQDEEEQMGADKSSNQPASDSDERELSKIDASSCLMNVISSFTPTAVQSAQVIVSCVAYPDLLPDLALTPILAKPKAVKFTFDSTKPKPKPIIVPTAQTPSATATQTKDQKTKGILLSDGSVASSVLSNISPPPTILSSIFSALNSPNSPTLSAQPPTSPAFVSSPSFLQQTDAPLFPSSTLVSVPLSTHLPISADLGTPPTSARHQSPSRSSIKGIHTHRNHSASRKPAHLTHSTSPCPSVSPSRSKATTKPIQDGKTLTKVPSSSVRTRGTNSVEVPAAKKKNTAKHLTRPKYQTNSSASTRI
ncbi:hypothetical protein BLNAU_12972 [Blattamonas nauphoetae]|uniref:Uncharacterized protein n=1 Tax=Blattamonas nauphoetae TaxID=2049346 RepID=A0ABQ9XPG5_9EUKA|nr:hypothetical protein BLNAU_12972 [Blattamonas nauphoetae]